MFMKSINSQNYSNYKIYLIDDNLSKEEFQ